MTNEYVYSEAYMDFEHDFDFLYMKDLKPKHLKRKDNPPIICWIRHTLDIKSKITKRYLDRPENCLVYGFTTKNKTLKSFKKDFLLVYSTGFFDFKNQKNKIYTIDKLNNKFILKDIENLCVE